MYEKVKYKEESLEPHLWTYRSRITLEHLRQTLQDEKMKEKYPILSEFLQAVCYCSNFNVQSLLSSKTMHSEAFGVDLPGRRLTQNNYTTELELSRAHTLRVASACI